MLKTEESVEFVDFLLKTHETIVNRPINGELAKVGILYKQFLSSKNPIDSNVIDRMGANFDDYVRWFNKISMGVLEMDRGASGSIKSVNLLGLSLLRDKLRGENRIQFSATIRYEPQDFESPKACLLKILDDGEHSRITGVDMSGDFKPYEIYTTKKDVIQLLEKESATDILGQRRSKLSTLKKPFSLVCENENHSRVLSKVCFSRKDMLSQGSRRQAFPSIEECHSAISQSQRLFPKEIYDCSDQKIHFLPIINSNTDIGLGDCSYLDTCHKMKNCRYVHYFSLVPRTTVSFDREKELKAMRKVLVQQEYNSGYCFNEFIKQELPAQWINCDIRQLPFSVLGKFAAIISDPAWDIHMSLPYGTCSDDELLSLPMSELQDEGILLLWVTGRSIEIGRKALLRWGYKITDEIIWIKLNQLKRTIVTGRTGHWLNHSKEHLLVGLKGEPSWVNRLVDINTIVSPTRETSRKPDEVYDLVERITGKHSRKLEIFGRDHNVRPGWFTIGNQLTGNSIHEREVLERYRKFQATKK